MTFELRSTAFEEGKMIPSRHTCDGDDVSPPLVWEGIPDETESLVVIMEDIDSVKDVWSHWVLYNVPPTIHTLAEDLPPSELFLWDGKHGRNDFDDIGYGGPCPSDGKAHRYVLRLYALDVPLEHAPGATREEILDQIDGHIVEETELMAPYKRLADR